VREADVVRRFYAAFGERDLATFLDAAHPDITFEPVLGVLFSRHGYRGHEGMTAWYEELHADWDSFEIPVEDVIAAGDHFVAFLRLVAHRGEETLDAQIAVECHVTGERISSIVGRDAWEVAEELGIEVPAKG
jgi:ketosteroid isomerase-like protein